MWECTIDAILDLIGSLINPGVVSRTVNSAVKWAITKQTVKFLQALMAREILAGFVVKKTI